MTTLITVADQDFAGRGRKPQRGIPTYYLVKFLSEKMQRKEKKSDQEGARVSGAPHFESTNLPYEKKLLFLFGAVT